MNRNLFRLVFSRIHQAFLAVAEISRARGKSTRRNRHRGGTTGSTLAAYLVATAGMLLALPALGASCGGYTCDVVVTINANNTVSVDTSAYGSGNSEDPAILVINNASTTVNSIVVSGTPGNGSFYDDYDGLYGGGPNGNSYETALATFPMSTSDPNLNSGTVTFTNGLATGQSTYFSLESLNNAFNVQTLTSPNIPTLNYSLQNLIDTNQPYYLGSGLTGPSLLPVFDGGTLRLDGTALGAYTFTIDANGGRVDLAGTSATISNPIADDTAGVPGNFSVVNSGTGGTLTLTGVNTYTGATSIDAGATLAVSGNGSIGSSSGLTDNGAFDISGANGDQSLASLSGSGQVHLGSNSLLLSNATGSFSGIIGGSGGITLQGGSETFGGANTYTGATVLAAGTTLNVATAGSLGNGSLSVGNGASIVFNNASQNVADLSGNGNVILNDTELTTNGNNQSTTFSGVLSGTGSLTKDGNGTLTLTGNNTFSGGTLLASGTQTFTITPGASQLLTTADVTDGADIILGGTGATIHSSTIVIDAASNLGGGGLTFDGGSLQAGADLSLSTAITVNTGNGAVDNNGHAVQLSGNIGGNGVLMLIGSGTTTLSGSNSYTGGTMLSAGTVSIGTAANLGTGQLAFNGNGSINNGGHADRFTGLISGAGSMTFIGTGVTTLTGSNSYTEGSNLMQGTVSIAAADNLGTGVINFYGGSLRTTSGVIFDARINTVLNGILDNGGSNDILSGGMAGNGTLTLAGSGSFAITGTNNATGTVNVDAGTLLNLVGSGNQLQVNTASNDGTVQLGSGAILAVTGSLANAGMLFGTEGLLDGNLVNTGGRFDVNATRIGTITPGAAPQKVSFVASTPSFAHFGQASVSGVSMVSGDFTQDANGTLVFGITPSSNTQLVVGGNVILDGNMDVQASTGHYLRTTYTLIQSTNPNATLSGQFSNVQVAGLPQNWGYDLTYVSDPQVLLSVYPLDAFTSAGKATNSDASNANVVAVGQVLDSQVPTASGKLYNQLNAMYQLPTAQLAGAIQQLDGELYADAPGMMAWVADDAWHPVYSRMGLSASERGVPPAGASHAWVSGLGSTAHTSNDGNATGLRQTLNGFLMGTDANLGRWTMGLTVGSVHAVGARQTTSSNRLSASLWQAGGYASTSIEGNGRFGVLLGYSGGSMHFGNDTVLGSAKARVPAAMFTAQMRGSWTIRMGKSDSITPILSLNGVAMHLNSAYETGLGPMSLVVPQQLTHAINTREQLRFNHEWNASGMQWNATASLGMQQNLVRPSHDLTLQYAGMANQSFAVAGVQANRNVGLFDAGLSAKLGSRTSLEFGYRGTFASRTRENAVQGKLVVTF
jgi:autotransporter-associated beta strand protein